MLNLYAAGNVDVFSGADVASTVVVGMLIVFAVLAIIFLCLVLMERVFRPNAKDKTVEVVSPFAGTVARIDAADAVKKKAIVMQLCTPEGDVAILAPKKGRVTLSVQAGATVQKGDPLFTME